MRHTGNRIGGSNPSLSASQAEIVWEFSIISILPIMQNPQSPAASRRPGRPQSFAKHSPPVLLAHFVGDSSTKSSHRVLDRDQSEPIPLGVTFIWVRTCNDGVLKCAITVFKASNRGLPKLPTTLQCA